MIGNKFPFEDGFDYFSVFPCDPITVLCCVLLTPSGYILVLAIQLEIPANLF